MAYVRQGPWSQGDPLSVDQITAIDAGIADARLSTVVVVPATSGTITLDAAVGDAFVVGLTASATIMVANLTTTGIARTVDVFLTTDGQTAMWDPAIAWPVGGPGVLAGDPDHIEIIGLPGAAAYLGRVVGSY